MNPMGLLHNKIAVVTGGSGGIGLAICEALGAESCEVVIADICQDRMEEAVSHLRSWPSL